MNYFTLLVFLDTNNRICVKGLWQVLNIPNDMHQYLNLFINLSYLCVDIFLHCPIFFLYNVVSHLDIPVFLSFKYCLKTMTVLGGCSSKAKWMMYWVVGLLSWFGSRYPASQGEEQSFYLWSAFVYWRVTYLINLLQTVQNTSPIPSSQI